MDRNRISLSQSVPNTEWQTEDKKIVKRINIIFITHSAAITGIQRAMMPAALFCILVFVLPADHAASHNKRTAVLRGYAARSSIYSSGFLIAAVI